MKLGGAQSLKNQTQECGLSFDKTMNVTKTLQVYE
jgi:hypothetical protein